ncbi:unnamed protein product [Miscanthus lutarioriparius]|uniref:IP5PC-F immunoglobulin-like domain-containing protein n=1 Tax=Miscanthus lutarioriparius TaxID=422564 RepID=A0A811PX13_9POAL|nr:unnamed protein product [Miscanthus lutarioriparius]
MRQKYGEIMTSNKEVLDYLQGLEPFPEVNISTNDIILQDQNPSVVKLHNRSTKELACFEIIGQTPNSSGTPFLGFPSWLKIAVAIETLLDLEDVSLDELVGRLKATEERLNRSKGRGGGGSGSGGAGKEIDGKLYFTEEQVIARLASRLNINADRLAARDKTSSGLRKRRDVDGRGKERGKDMRSGPPKGGGGGEDDNAYHYCGKAGHWKWECRKKKRDEEKAAAAAAAYQPQANLA